MARRLGRHWLGIEREKRYCRVARERIVEHSQIRRKSEAYNGGYAQSA